MNNEFKNSIKESIKSYLANGLCALPATTQKKRPVVSWKEYQDKLPTFEQVDKWFEEYEDINAVAIICGAVSGNLEVMDFDWAGKSMTSWEERIDSSIINPSSLVFEETQNHGYHVVYRINDKVEGNRKLTWKKFSEDELDDDGFGGKLYNGKRVLPGKDGSYGGCTIETRGEGGLIICSPSVGYATLNGSWLNIPVLTREQAKYLCDKAVELSDASLVPVKRESTYVRPFNLTQDNFSSADYLRCTNATAEILARHGWTFVGFYNGDSDCELWRRPGKSEGISGLRHADDGRFHVYTTSTELNGGSMYSPLQLLAALEYNGDEKAASRAVWETVAPKYVCNTIDMGSLTAHDQSLIQKELDEQESRPLDESSRTALIEGYPRLSDAFLSHFSNEHSFFKAFMKTCQDNSGIKQDELYFGAALTTLAHIVGDKVCMGSLYPNLYSVCSAASGCGKDAPYKHSRKVCQFYDIASVTNGFQSEQVMGDMFRAKSKLIWVEDEFGQRLNTAFKGNAKGANNPLFDVLKLCTSIWSSAGEVITTGASRKNKELTKKEEGSDGKNELSYRPYLSILGFTTLASLQQFLSSSGKQCGTTARFIFPVGNSTPKREYLEAHGRMEVNAIEKAVCQEWRDFGTVRENDVVYDFNDFEDERAPKVANESFIGSHGFEMKLTPEARKLDMKFFENDNKRLNEANSCRGEYADLQEFLARTAQYRQKFAMLFACDKYGANPDKLVIDEECLQLANEYFWYTIKCIKYIHDTNSNNETSAETEMKRLLTRLRSKLTGKNDFAVIKKSDFTSWFRNKTTRQEILSFLSDAGIVDICIQSCPIGNGATRESQIFKIDIKKLDKCIRG